MCKADPPGWREDRKGNPWWYNGGPNYGKPCVPVPALYDGRPALSCLFCGKFLLVYHA